jgi:hypothetical protein
MIKILTIFILLASSLYAQPSLIPQKANIVAIDKNQVIVNSPADVAIGSSGIVLRSFDSIHKTIIASTKVVKKEGNKLYLSLQRYDGLKQEILPTYDIGVKVGDEVVLNYQYNRALAITPDAATYKTLTTGYSTFDWVHPDIFAASLASSFAPNPSRKTFKDECNQDSIGLLLFAIKDKAYFVDCRSFAVISTTPIQPSATAKSPFYTRIDGIKGRLFGLFGGKEIKNYDSYYTKLLNGK